MDNHNEQLTLFDNQEAQKNIHPTALPESATVEWKNLYQAISDYAKRLKEQ